MADAGNDSRALVPAHPGASAVAPPRPLARGQKWEVEYARYFGTPRRDPSAPPPAGLRHITRGIHRHQGTWLPASSTAELCVSRSTLLTAVPVLTVSIGDVVFVRTQTPPPFIPSFFVLVSIPFLLNYFHMAQEEHFVSILNFSWPQVTCVTQCPIRGSRVVFMSFCDKTKQASRVLNCGNHLSIQKFALRFPQLCDAESFINCVKVSFDAGPDDASSFEEQASDHMIEAAPMSYHEEPDLPILEPLSASNTNNSYSGFPPSFSQMLANCSTENEQDTEEPYPVGTTNHASQEVYALDNSHDVAVATEETTADKGMDAGEGIDTSVLTGDIMARIKTYMADDSFNDMLFKLEKVIDELGGDMLL
nr:unnamed protein product [Digitaria exilis]